MTFFSLLVLMGDLVPLVSCAGRRGGDLYTLVLIWRVIVVDILDHCNLFSSLGCVDGVLTIPTT